MRRAILCAWSITTVLLVSIFFLQCSNKSLTSGTGNPSEPAEGALISVPVVTLPEGYTVQDLEITEASIELPASFHRHEKTLSKAYDISLKKRQKTDFGEKEAVLCYSYNHTTLNNLGCIPQFQVYYYDCSDSCWKQLEKVEVDRVTHTIKAYTSHFTPFVVTALTDPWILVGGNLNSEPKKSVHTPLLAFHGSTPYVSWISSYASGSEHEIIVKYYDRTRQCWVKLGKVAPANSEDERYIIFYSMHISEKGVPYLTWEESIGDYYAGTFRFSIFVRRWNGSEWEMLKPQINTEDSYGTYPALICVGETPYVAYREITEDNDFSYLYLKKWNGSEWVQQGDHFNNDVVKGVNLAQLATNGRDVFASWVRFSDLNSDEGYQLYVKKWDGSSWQQLGDELNVHPHFKINDYAIACEKDGKPYAAFFENNYKLDQPREEKEEYLFVKKWDGSEWQQLGGSLKVESWGAGNAALTLVKSRPYVAWEEALTAYPQVTQVVVKYWDGSEWVQHGETLNVDKYFHTDAPSIGFSGITPCVAFSEWDRDHSLYVKAGNWQEPVSEEASLPVITKFSLTTPMPTYTRNIRFELEAEDDTGIDGWMITGTPIKPFSTDFHWQTEKPTDCYMSEEIGVGKTCYNLYAWARDHDQNVSELYYELPVQFYGIELESASNQNYGAGTFGDPAFRLSRGDYPVLTLLQEGRDYEYGAALDNTDGKGYAIYDSATEGTFGKGSYLRIVENGKNIVDAGGLALTPVARNLSVITSPDRDEVFIDPSKGCFVLPRPSYWSRLENTSCIDNFSIAEQQPASRDSIVYMHGTPLHGGGGVFTTSEGKFGNAVTVSTTPGNGNKGHQAVIKPFGACSLDWNKGTISAWINVTSCQEGGTDYGYAFGRIGGVDIDYRNNFMGTGYDGNGSQAQASTFWAVEWGGCMRLPSGHSGNPICDAFLVKYGTTIIGPIKSIEINKWHHLYIVWDRAGLASGYLLRVFLDGKEMISTREFFEDASGKELNIHLSTFITDISASSSIDNLKIWRHVVAESPDWEYNSGYGREDSLHVIYSRSHGYSPVLDFEQKSGVGYFFSYHE